MKCERREEREFPGKDVDIVDAGTIFYPVTVSPFLNILRDILRLGTTIKTALPLLNRLEPEVSFRMSKHSVRGRGGPPLKWNFLVPRIRKKRISSVIRMFPEEMIEVVI